MKKTAFIFAAILMAGLLLSSCGGTSDVTETPASETQPAPVKLSEIADIEKGYFGAEHSSFTIELDDYINANGAELFYTEVTSSDPTVATAVFADGEISVTLHAGEGSTDISIGVLGGDDAVYIELFRFDFTVTAKTYERVACIGDSLTYGHAWPDQAYPVYLQNLLGEAITVGNFGHNGASITGLNPSLYLKYEEQQAYADSMAFDPDLLVIMLGTNDSKGWDEAAGIFEEQYKGLISAYQTAFVDADIILVTAPPTMDGNLFNIPNDIIRDSVVPLQRKTAEDLALPMLDLRQIMEDYEGGYEALIRGDAAADGVHLSEMGASMLAELLAEMIWAQ